MSVITKPLQELVQELPPDERAEVRDFIEYLLAKRSGRARTTLRQDWKRRCVITDRNTHHWNFNTKSWPSSQSRARLAGKRCPTGRWWALPSCRLVTRGAACPGGQAREAVS